MMMDMDDLGQGRRDFRRQWRRELGLPPDADDKTDRAMSEASTSTLRPTSTSMRSTPSSGGLSHFSWTASAANLSSGDDFMHEDTEESERNHRAAPNETSFIIATDFGTTFSSVAFTKCQNGRWGRIESVKGYPDDPRPGNRDSLQVPTESWYTNQEIYRDESDHLTRTCLQRDLLDDDLYNMSDDERSPPQSTESIPHGSLDTEESIDNDEKMTDTDADMADNEGLGPLIWGYGVQVRLASSDLDQSQFKRIARSKLLLDTSSRTQQIRDQLRPTLNKLKYRRTINNYEDVIADYLTFLFNHTKQYLTDYHGLSENSPIEHVLCVPNVWLSQSSRKMQTAMETAIKVSGLGSMENLFIVSEPEAAATYVLRKNTDVNPGETFLIIDAGGGTVDLTTYKVHQQYPLRLMQEAIEPSGGLFGSSYINEGFRQKLVEKLEEETYLETRGFTIEGIADAATIHFENVTKRSLDITGQIRHVDTRILVQGLQPNKAKKFTDHRIILDRDDYKDIYIPVLRGISRLMKKQLQDARAARIQVKKVILIGGFAGSPSLRNFLSTNLKQISVDFGYNIRLIDPGAPETAVAYGAVLRALDKEGGPQRIIQSSYGFLRTEPHEDKAIPAHKEVRPTIDLLDGNSYVRNTIDWLVKKGDEVPPRHEYPIEVYHTFPITEEQLLCEELLYVSDTSTESHYRRTHAKNRGAEQVGSIQVDMTFLARDGLIQPIYPEPGYVGEPHYKVEFQLVMIIDGRNLRYEARWPAGGEVQGSGQISIAAAFLPGTD